jgi:hypothetical protein
MTPAAAAHTPPTLFVMTYEAAFIISPLPIIFATSKFIVDAVVNEPQNPTPRRSFIRGVSPIADVDEIVLLAGAEEVLLAVEAIAEGSINGDPKTPPKIKEPRTFIPAVCQPVHSNKIRLQFVFDSAAL